MLNVDEVTANTSEVADAEAAIDLARTIAASSSGAASVVAPQVAPGSLISTLLRAVAVGFSCLAAAIAATWPLVLNITTAIPEGTEHEATVSLFSLWGLWWTADRAAHAFAGYWDAPFFHPAQGVTTFSEPFPLVGVAVAPLWGLNVAPALIYNIALLGLLTLNGIFTYRLARSLGATTIPSLMGGLIAVTLPFVAKVEGALPLAAAFGMPWTLEGLVRFGSTGSKRWAAWTALGFVALYLTFEQYALLFAPFALAAGLIALRQQRFSRPAVARLGAAGAMAAILLAFVAIPQLRVHAEQGFRRSDELVQALSARPADFLTRPELTAVQFPPADASDTGGLFPGILLLAFATIGAAVGLTNTGTRKWSAFLLVGVAGSIFLAMALNVDIGGWRPYTMLRASPGFSELRSPTRATAIGQILLATLAAIGLSSLQRRWQRMGVALVVVLGVLAAAENLSVPARLTPVPSSFETAWTDWVRAQPDDTVIAHVPFPAGLHVSDYEIETRRMVAQIEHQKPIVNGYSGNFPQAHTPLGLVVPIYTQFQLAMSQQFPSEQLFCIMDRGLDVNLLVVDRDWLADHTEQMERYSTFLEPAYADEQVQIYRLHAPPGKCTSG